MLKIASNNNRSNNITETANINCMLFLDVETVPAYPDFESLPENFKELWIAKSFKYRDETLTPEQLYFEKAGIHAEFGKIVCISVGYFNSRQEGNPFRVRSFYGNDEASILQNFKDLLDKSFNDCTKHFLCAHNGIEFDFPYIGRRMLINGIKLPALLNISGSKSWNNKWLIDTMELWRFGDFKERTSLALLAACFNIQSPKDDISGKDVARVYYEEENLERIKIYCEKDVVTLARIYQKFAALIPVPEEDVIYL